jgi:glutamate synthase (NADPH/NADH) large chain
MSGGMAFVHDPMEVLERRINDDMVIYQRIEVDHYTALLRGLLAEHVAETQSEHARRILHDLDRELPHFWQIVPKEMLSRLEVPVKSPEALAANQA